MADGTLRLKALESCKPSRRLTPFERRMYQLYERISPWRGGSADGPGPLRFDAVQSALDAEGLRGYERECAESLLAAMDAEFRSEAARAARERMRQAKNG